MRRAALVAVALFAGTAGSAGPALAHHSIAAMYDRERDVAVSGVLSRMDVQNPHSLLEVTARDDDGKAVVWQVESRGVQGMARLGFDKSAVSVGDRVAVKGSPARSGERQLWLVELETSGRRYDFRMGRR